MHNALVASALVALVGCAAADPGRTPVPTTPAGAAVSAPTTLDAKRGLFARAHATVEAGDHASALPLLDALCPVYLELRDHCWHDLAASRAATGDVSGADRIWAQLGQETPQSIYASRVPLERGRLRRRLGDDAGARELFEAARASATDDVALQAALELATMDADAGNTEAADAQLTALRWRALGTPVGAAAKRRQHTLREAHPALAAARAAQVEELRLLIKERDVRNARPLADALLPAAAPFERPEMLRLRAEAELGTGDLEAALRSLQEVAGTAPDPAMAAEAQYRLATVLWNRDRNDDARVAFVEFRRRFPADARMPDVLYALGRIAQGAGRGGDAVALYRETAVRYPGSGVARDARWRIGWIAYGEARYREAAAAFADAAAGATTADAPEAYYWRARALERGGDTAHAQQGYQTIVAETPGSYYAERAERRLGRREETRGRISPPRTTPSIGAVPAGADPFHWTRAVELQAIGAAPLARIELRAFERTAGSFDDPGPLIAAYQTVGGFRDAIRVGSAYQLTDPAIFFPLAFWPQLSAATARHQVDPLFALALMRQESMFDPAARSPADARGLMQLLPSTAARVARTTGQPDGDLYDPEINIPLGVAHLRELEDRYGGDRVKVLAAYNGGENAVARWEDRFGSLEPDEFVESITYRETRDYVKRVLGNYRRYRQAYARE